MAPPADEQVITSREVSKLFDELKELRGAFSDLNAKFDSAMATIRGDLTARLAALEQWKIGHEGADLKSFSDVVAALHGDDGLAPRLRKAEAVIGHYKVVAGILGAIAAALGSVLINHLLGGKG